MWLSTMISVGRASSALNSSKARVDPIEVVGVFDPDDVPAVALEASGDVVARRRARCLPSIVMWLLS